MWMRLFAPSLSRPSHPRWSAAPGWKIQDDDLDSEDFFDDEEDGPDEFEDEEFDEFEDDFDEDEPFDLDDEDEEEL